MIVWFLLLLEFFLIFASSRYIFQALFSLLYKVSKSQKFSFSAISLFFFPGTLLHELSHLITAEALRVPVHGIEFIPEYRDGSLKMGSVKIQKTDFVRSLVIGAAPFFTGFFVLTLFLWVAYSYVQLSDVFSSLVTFGLGLLSIYLVFVITNTMFSSKKDMDGIYVFALFVGSIVLVLYILGLRLDSMILSILDDNFIESRVWLIVSLMSIPLTINILVVFISQIFTKKIT